MWVIPKVNRTKNTIEFRISDGDAHEIEGTVSRKGAVCLLSKAAMPFSYVREQAKKGNMKNRLMAMVTDGNRARCYHAPLNLHERAAEAAAPKWRPDCEMPQRHPFRPPIYGMDNMGDLFTSRQLVALDTLCDLISATREKILANANGDAGYANCLLYTSRCV